MGLTLQTIVFDDCVYMYMLFYVCVGIHLVDGLQQSLFMIEFDCPEGTLCWLIKC